MKKYIAVMILLAASSCGSFAASTYSPYQTFNPYANTSMQNNLNTAMLVPIGTVIPVTTSSELNSKFLLLGQSVSVMLTQDFYYNGKLVAPIGSTIQGTVVSVKKATFGGVDGEVQIRFTNIITTYGRTIPISAKIKTDDNSGLIVGSRNLNFGTLRSVDTNLQLGKSIDEKGNEVIIPSNTNINIVLEQPMSIHSTSSFGY